MIPDKKMFTKSAGCKIEDILDRLDAATVNPPSVDRNQRKWSYRRSDTRASFEHPGGGTTEVLTYTRTLWCEGMSLLCAGFVYSGSVFKTSLKSKDGEAMSVSGTVVGCRHVDSRFHEIDLKFNQRIDPHLFIDLARNASDESSASLDLMNLYGKILHLDDSEADARLLGHYLRGSAIELKSVRTSDEALDSLRKSAFDIFLCDLNLGDGVDGTSVVKRARAAGFLGPIVVITAETNPAKQAAIKEAGAEYILTKPYLRNSLVQMMVKMHQLVGAITDGEVLYSTLSGEPETDDLLASYVASTQKIAQDIQKSVVARNLSMVRELCLNIHGSATGYGFIPLGTAAEQAIRALDGTMSVDESRPQIRKLTLLCGQLGLRRNPAQEQAPKKDPNRLV